MKLYSGPLSMFGAKAEIAAHEKGLAFELVMVPFDMTALYQPKHPEVLRINPKLVDIMLQLAQDEHAVALHTANDQVGEEGGEEPGPRRGPRRTPEPAVGE